MSVVSPMSLMLGLASVEQRKKKMLRRGLGIQGLQLTEHDRNAVNVICVFPKTRKHVNVFSLQASSKSVVQLITMIMVVDMIIL